MKSVAITVAQYDSWRSGDMVAYDAESLELIENARVEKRSVVIAAPESEIEHLLEAAYADANHEFDRKRCAAVLKICNRLKEALSGRQPSNARRKPPKIAAYTWAFRARFRKGGFNWKGSRLAIARIDEALTEIKLVARTDSVLAADGSVTLLQRLSPALEQVDSSSGAVGSAVHGAIKECAAIIGAAQADAARRDDWLDRLWKALNEDGMGYMDSLGDHWGEFCGSPEAGSRWADDLLPALVQSLRPRDAGGSYFSGSAACFSALLAAKRYQEILDILEQTSSTWWHYREWGFRALVFQGRRADALRYAEVSRSSNEGMAVAAACEELLLQSGMADEAYRRYGVAASGWAPTYVARYRALVKKYPHKSGAELLRDLVAATPGSEGKWFAAAKSAGLLEEAISLARSSPCDPRTLSRAARDFATKRPEFAMDVAIAALRWFAEGYGYETTASEIREAYDRGLGAAKQLDRVAEYRVAVTETLSSAEPFFRKALGEM